MKRINSKKVRKTFYFDKFYLLKIGITLKFVVFFFSLNPSNFCYAQIPQGAERQDVNLSIANIKRIETAIDKVVNDNQITSKLSVRTLEKALKNLNNFHSKIALVKYTSLFNPGFIFHRVNNNVTDVEDIISKKLNRNSTETVSKETRNTLKSIKDRFVNNRKLLERYLKFG